MDSKSYTPGSRDILYKKIFLSISEMKYLEREIKKFNWLERTFLRKKSSIKCNITKANVTAISLDLSTAGRTTRIR
jgi:hypothetical protein